MGSLATDQEYKSKMTRMALCPTFDEDEEDWWEDEDSSSSVESGDDNGKKVLEESMAKVEACSSKVTDSDNVSTEEEKNYHDTYADYPVVLYEPVDGIVMDFNLLLQYPTTEDLQFETSCATCSTEVGPPINCCVYAHVICDLCLETCKTNCGSEIMVSPEEGSTRKCMAGITGIDAAIQNTPYYKEFMKSCRYDCGLKSFGCDVVLSGMEIMRHEFLECPFRLIHYCGFQSVGCTATFMDLQENVEHLIREHNLPVQRSSQANFNVKFNPKELVEMDCSFIKDVPSIRAAIGASDKHFLCLLITEDVENGKTRLWFLKVFCDNDNRFTATVSFYSPKSDENNLEGNNSNLLTIVPEVKNVGNLTESAAAAGCNYYVDLDNKMLEEYSFEKDGENYFGMTVVIMEHIKKTGPRKKVSKTKSHLQELREKIAEKRKQVQKLEACPYVKHYENLEELDAESERRDTVKKLKEEIMDMVLLAESMEENEEDSDE